MVKRLCTKAKKVYKKNRNCILFFTILIAVLVLITYGVIVIFHRQNQFIHWITQNTGSVADWIGNVSIPIVLAWASHQLTVQKEHQKREEKAEAILKTLFDLLALIQKELPQNSNQPDYNLRFKETLKNNISLISKTRDMIYSYRGLNNSEPIYQELKRIISVAQNSDSINFNQAEEIKKTLSLASNDLLDKYQHFMNSK